MDAEGTTEIAPIYEEPRQEIAASAPQYGKMVSLIEKIALNPDLPIERLSSIMDMMERQMSMAAEQAFNKAFAIAMANMPDVPRSGLNKHTGNTYSTLDDLIRTSRPLLGAQGLTLNWDVVTTGDNFVVTAIVRHSDGHSITTSLEGKRDTGKQMTPLQGGGSTATYLKRYTGFSILGLASGDEVEDDGVSNGKSGSKSGSSITETQYSELAALIEKAGITETVVCAAEKIGFLPELPANRFAWVRGQLEETITKNNMEDA